MIVTTGKIAKKQAFFISQSPKFSSATCNIQCAITQNILQTGFHNSTRSLHEINTCDTGMSEDLTEYQPYFSPFGYILRLGLKAISTSVGRGLYFHSTFSFLFLYRENIHTVYVLNLHMIIFILNVVV